MSLLLLSAEAAALCFARAAYVRLDGYNGESIKVNKNKNNVFDEVTSSPGKKYGLILSHTPGDFFMDKVYPSFPGSIKDLMVPGFFKDRFSNTAKQAYDALLSRGYAKDNLFVLEGCKTPSKRFDCNNLPLNKKSLDEVLKHLSKEIKPDDAFFMMVSTHGGKFATIPGVNVGQSFIYLNDSENSFLYEKELEERLSNLHPNYSILFFNSCFGNGFAKRLAKGRTVTVSSARQNKAVMIFGEEDNNRRFGPYAGSFVLGFLSAFQKRFPDGTLIECLPDNDDLESAFDFGVSFETTAHIRQARNMIESNCRLYKPALYLMRNTPCLYYDKINPAKIKL